MTETCTDQPEGVWIADGSRDCKYLTSLYPEDQIWGVYAARERLCANSSTRCCASCKAVNSDVSLSVPSRTGIRLLIDKQTDFLFKTYTKNIVYI
ncbi:hypothetical protein DPMN_150913 [Dreissena polymorpha]|uniref:Uncharacterized protein n=1 Tax=Dreissena polymorpha TaxID=45954 RepID=A0A9D4FE54_DREPO|nr:hypothetical protein DPMN_150913 [Dreissena polymorpha]